MVSRRPPAGKEMMDDYSISGDVLFDALKALPRLNRLLGAKGLLRREFSPILRHHRNRELTVLDVGTGIGDLPIQLCSWAAAAECRMRIVAIDANPDTISFAERFWGNSAAHRNTPCVVEFRTADAFDLPYEDGSFDYVFSSQFLHHFEIDDAARLVREMDRTSRGGVLVSDLHRNWVARVGICAICEVLQMPRMIVHDAPLSVSRGFVRSELVEIAENGGLKDARIRWKIPFRWSVSTFESLT